MDGYNQNNTFNQPINNNEDPFFIKGLILSILELICCNWVTGVPAVIMVLLANSDFKSNDIKGYESKVRICKILLLVGLILGIIIITLSLIINGLGFVISIFDSIRG